MSTRIKEMRVREFNIPLTEPFTITLGTTYKAENVLVSVELENGVVGYGEGAPFVYVTGETQQTAIKTIEAAKSIVEGKDVTQYRAIAEELARTFRVQTAARMAMEMAILDALTKSWGIPMYQFFGGVSDQVETDMTIPIVPAKEAYEKAKHWAEQGFNHLKIKVGTDLEADVERVEAIAEAAPSCHLKVDANQGYSPKQALEFLSELEKRDIAIELLEQPVPHWDLKGMKFVTQNSGVPIAADESVFSSRDALRVALEGAADIINIKLAKASILDVVNIHAICQSYGLGLMVGCMIESRLALSMAVHMTAGLGGFSYFDLDGFLSLAEEPIIGGFKEQAGVLSVAHVKAGIGAEPKKE
ncbi:MAG: dipeptide epimerase [Firmicutes bacterium]|nr:dipeptide epimerase [Bacillota bacterium]